jgi:hypothetical protein
MPRGAWTTAVGRLRTDRDREAEEAGGGGNRNDGLAVRALQRVPFPSTTWEKEKF